MKKVLIYVEGQTEETFVRTVLTPYLSRKCGLFLVSTLARTKRTKSGRTFKGGIVSFGQIRRDLIRLLSDSSALAVTTMIDYYNLPDDFPGKATIPDDTPYRRVAYLEKAFEKAIGHHRFLPFLVLHEFETFVLVDPEKLGEALPQYRYQVPALEKDVGSLPPEEIDEGNDTHPAARISRYFPAYQKALHGPRIVQSIGLKQIRERCPHFNEWLGRLESLC